MSISSLLCDPNDPNVISPPQPDGMPIKKETSLAATEILVTRTPPPIQGIRNFFPDFEFHPSDESDNEDDIEELPRTSSTDLQAPSPKRRRLNYQTPSDVYTFGLHHDELYMWDFYDHVTCKILSCKNAKGENPWRDDLICRAQSQSVEALKHALFAMTSFHMKLYGVDDPDRMADRGLFHTNLAFQSLIKRMKAGVEFDENDIAAMLVLSFSEVIPFHFRC
jgi:hypothetical protein